MHSQWLFDGVSLCGVNSFGAAVEDRMPNLQLVTSWTHKMAMDMRKPVLLWRRTDFL
jgi:hypothetical protein